MDIGHSHPINVATIALLVFLVIGASATTFFAIRAAIKLKDSGLKLWWLLVSIALSQGTIAIQNSLGLLVRMEHQGWVKSYSKWDPATIWESQTALLLAMGSTAGTWICLLTSIAVSHEIFPLGKWVKGYLMGSLWVFTVSYPLLLVGLFTGLIK